MKWPNQLVVVRHGQSAYNVLKQQKKESPLYQEFVQSWKANFCGEGTRKLALEVLKKFKLKEGDAKTPLTEMGIRQAQITGAKLKNIIALPDVIFISPYTRTKETFENLKVGWPELEKVKFYIDERIREQGHGLALLYNDWRVFFTMHPEQKALYETEGQYYYCYPQGQNVPGVRRENRSWITTVVRDFNGKNVLAISHHLTILSLRAHLERLSDEEFIRLDREEKPVNCGVTIYRGDPTQGEDGRLILQTYNQKFY